MQTLHALRLPAAPNAGASLRLTFDRLVRAIARPIAAWRQDSLRRATVRTLHGLDDRTLHDLGVHRSEIGGLAAEIAGQAELSYVRAAQARRLRA